MINFGFCFVRHLELLWPFGGALSQGSGLGALCCSAPAGYTVYSEHLPEDKCAVRPVFRNVGGIILGKTTRAR